MDTLNSFFNVDFSNGGAGGEGGGGVSDTSRTSESWVTLEVTSGGGGGETLDKPFSLVTEDTRKAVEKRLKRKPIGRITASLIKSAAGGRGIRGRVTSEGTKKRASHFESRVAPGLK